LNGSWPEIRLVRLAGHTAGHVGVAVPAGDGRWLLHAGDAHFHRVTIDGTAKVPLGSGSRRRVHRPIARPD
jgi:glyoxylase-like metal-dependent hydrolase (beta-lactamase superfamily II)